MVLEVLLATDLKVIHIWILSCGEGVGGEVRAGDAQRIFSKPLES